MILLTKKEEEAPNFTEGQMTIRMINLQTTKQLVIKEIHRVKNTLKITTQVEHLFYIKNKTDSNKPI